MKTVKLTATKAILIGHLIINIPIISIITCISYISLALNLGLNLGLLTGIILGWIYWSYLIPRWRQWAINRGVNEANLDKWARRTLLTWKNSN